MGLISGQQFEIIKVVLWSLYAYLKAKWHTLHMWKGKDPPVPKSVIKCTCRFSHRLAAVKCVNMNIKYPLTLIYPNFYLFPHYLSSALTEWHYNSATLPVIIRCWSWLSQDIIPRLHFQETYAALQVKPCSFNKNHNN